jgi:hypothetical protein
MEATHIYVPGCVREFGRSRHELRNSGLSEDDISMEIGSIPCAPLRFQYYDLFFLPRYQRFDGKLMLYISEYCRVVVKMKLERLSS